MGDANPIRTLRDYSKPRHEGYSGPHDTQYCMENPEQAFVEYASSRTDEAGGLVSNFMASQDARLSKFEVDFKQQQNEMTNKIDTVLKAITDRIAGALPSDTVKNPKLNVNSTSTVLSARSYPTKDPQCSTQIHSSINTIAIYQSNPHNDKPEKEEQEEKDDRENINTNPSPQPYPSVSFITKNFHKLNSFFESLSLVPQSSNIEFVCSKCDDDDVIFIEIIKKDDDSHIEEPEVGENTRVGELEVEYFDIFMTRSKLAYHKYLMCGPIPSIFLRNAIITEGCPPNLKVPCNIGHVHVEKAYIDLNSPLNVMTRMLYNWIMRRKLDPKENTNGGVNNFTGRIKGMHVFVGNFTYVIDFMAIEDISSIIDPRFTNETDEIAYKMPHKIEQYDSLSDLEREPAKSVYLRNEEDNKRWVEYVMSKVLGFYKECLDLGTEYVIGTADEGEVTKEHVTSKRGDGVASIKRRHRDLSSDGVRKLTTASGHVSVKDFEPTLPLIKKKLTVVDANFMVREVYDEEIKEVTFQIDGNKAPRSDGFSSLFFKKVWDIVGDNVCSAIKEFFCYWKDVKRNQFYSDFFDPKGISKKYSGTIPSAFVPNRHIQDNILLSHKLLKGCDRKDGPNRVAMKIDTQKAYDTVNWKFLECIFKGFGFHEKMMTCLYFAMVIKDLNTLKEAIEEFGSLSGLRSNYDKSTIIFGSMQMEDKQAILECVPFKVEQLPVKYLGVPLTSKRIGVNNCRSLIDKIKNKWASVSLLPKSILKDINKLLKGFLWNQGELSRGKAKVKDEDRSFIVMNTGNGEKAYVINNNWCGVGILQSFITHRDLYNVRRNDDMVVKDIVDNGVCMWPEEWIAKYPRLALHHRIVLNTDKEDTIVWRSKSGKDGRIWTLINICSSNVNMLQNFGPKLKSKLVFKLLICNGMI
ncbi:hypothetical protein Tco_0151448 [Tanacetum coccineum]